MNDMDLISRIETLESRLMHQEATIDEITRTLLGQEQLITSQKKAIETLENQLQSLTAASIMQPGEEPPPPHY
ncbi:MAG: SlyX family protein [Gammaproteobacteria bacterium]|jgi:SlyX protein|nr:SlyX family protein [Gammaproteobacteria bacterium]